MRVQNFFYAPLVFWLVQGNSIGDAGDAAPRLSLNADFLGLSLHGDFLVFVENQVGVKLSSRLEL